MTAFRWLPRRRWTFASAAVLGLMISSSCSKNADTGPHARSIIVTPSPLALNQLGSGTLTVSVLDDKNEAVVNAVVTFSSSNAQIITVSPVGVVTSVGPAGSASVTVRSGGAAQTVPVTVAGVAAGITVTPSPATLPQKTTLQLQASVIDAVGAPLVGAPLTYTSAAPSIMTVSSTGLVTSLGAAGTVVITVASGPLTRAVNVTATAVPTDIALSPASVLMAANSSSPMSASLLDAVGTPIAGATFTWTSSAPGTVAVNSSGVLTSGATLGSATITVKNATFVKTATVNVVASAHPAGTIVTSAANPSAWALAISNNDLVIAPQLSGNVTGTVQLPSNTVSHVAGAGGVSVVVNNAGTLAYMADNGNGYVDILDITNGVFLQQIASPNALSVALSFDEATLFVGTSGTALYEYNAATHALLATRTVTGGQQNAIARHPTLPLLYITSNTGKLVQEFNMQTHAITRTFSLGSAAGNAQQPVLSSDGNTLWVPAEGDQLYSFDLTTGTLTGSYPGMGGFGMAMSRDGLQLWITDGTANVKIFDVNAHTSRVIAVGAQARRIVFSKDGLTAVISGADGKLVFVQ